MITKSIESQDREALITKLSSVVEQTADHVMITDKAGTVEYVNPAFEQTTGYSQADVVGKSSRILKSGRHPREFYEKMWTTILGGHPFQATMVNRKKNGDFFYTEKTITPITINSEPISHFVSTDKDVTEEHRQMEKVAAELRRSNEELSQFAAIASHDLQEPLRTMSTYLRLLKRKNETAFDAESREFLEFVMNAAGRLQDLIRDLLTFSKVGATVPRYQEFSCTDAFLEAVRNLNEAITASKANVQIKRLPTITGDRSQFVRVLENLIGNALKYRRSDATPSVCVTAERNSEGWIFNVSDNGIGISPDGTEKLFKMFQRLHAKSEYPGTGIGLAICKKIVEGRGGKIWVTSCPGKGSTFSFSVPDALPTMVTS